MAAALTICAAGAASASDPVLYSNGPINGEVDAFTIDQGFQIADSFTLTHASTLTGVTLSLWQYPGDTTTSVDWGITTTANSYPVTGTAVVTQDSVVSALNGDSYTTVNDSFALPDVTLAAGTYYLVLQNASVTAGDPVYWDSNEGVSVAYANWYGNLANYDYDNNLTNSPSSSSETFSILGVVTAAPEPGTWAMMLVGAAVIGGALRSRRAALLAQAV
ncbi:MAG TPA: PEPxxWA-CTERM sorting domain-containing protein [Caulobacteraceae bacterium]|nr:PEPxxWA-CTERM sorting domain-containing protein [Caulobacteraceae bacterium]